MEKNIDISNLTIIILTGGKSKRMGSDKSQLRFYESNFIRTVIDHSEKISNKIIVVCSKKNKDLFIDLKETVVVDETAGQGPMMGIITGLKNANTDWSLILSVDTPFFTSDMMQKLWDKKANYVGAIFKDKAGIHPLNALYKTSTLKDWEKGYKTGDMKLKSVLKKLDINYIEVTGLENETLRNINNREEYNKFITKDK